LLIVLLQSENFFPSCFSLLIPVLKKQRKNLSSPAVLFTR
jgi:hypothetical protein